MELRPVSRHALLISPRTAVVLAAIALLGIGAPALATTSAYADYCSLHPHKSYCWDRHHRAFADYASAVETDAGYADTYFNRGNAYDDIKDFDRAVAEYSKAIAIDPMSADSYSDRG